MTGASHGVLVRVRCCHRIPQTRRLTDSTSQFPRGWRPEAANPGASGSGVCEGPSSLCPHVAEGRGEGALPLGHRSPDPITT